MLPPSSQLPHIKSIRLTALDKLQSSVDYLWTIYNPPVRGSLRRRRSRQLQTSLSPSTPDVRTDLFEREYSMKWLTALISQLGSVDGDHDEVALLPHVDLIDNAASLLATCAGTASAGTISRTFVFDLEPTDLLGDPGDDDQSTRGLASSRMIKVELEDVPLDNHDYGSVGAQTWGSACIMADMIAENPGSFGLPRSSSLESFRCLELGAGTGLVSLTVAKILERHLYDTLHPIDNLKKKPGSTDPTLPLPLPDIEIIPSDYYPAVLSNLERNIRANFTDIWPLHVHSQPLDWSVFSESDPASDPAVLQNGFDVIYGADIVYEARHAEWIKGCLMKLLRKPAQVVVDEDPAFHLVIPLRRTHTAESNTIERIFGTRDDKRDDSHLIIKGKEVIICDSETGSVEEVEYVYYRIGWGLNTGSENLS